MLNIEHHQTCQSYQTLPDIQWLQILLHANGAEVESKRQAHFMYHTFNHGRQHFVACCACRMELKLSMDIKALRGPLYVWLPPPPGDRMWFSFLEAPQLQVTASPLVGLILNKVLRYVSHGRATNHVTSH